jgi:hypothetical protein
MQPLRMSLGLRQRLILALVLRQRAERLLAPQPVAQRQEPILR